MEYKKIPIRKSWGQNFIIDQNIITKIIQIINPNKNDIIFEIGPGRGALTLPLSKLVKKINAIEIDPLLVKLLKKENNKNINLINDDILNINFNDYKSTTKVVGNLPYYITSPIIFKMIGNKYVKKMIFMVQKEVADRIVSNHNTKNFSRISVMVQTFCKAEIKYNISKNIFHPRPKVDSSIIVLKKINNNLDLKKYSIFIKNAFKQKRKKLKNNLKDIINIKGMEIIGDRRAENISTTEYIKIFKNYML